MSSKPEEKAMPRIESARSFGGNNNRDSSIISSTVSQNNTSDSHNRNTTIYQFVFDPNVGCQSRDSLINRIACQQTQQSQHTQHTHTQHTQQQQQQTPKPQQTQKCTYKFPPRSSPEYWLLLEREVSRWVPSPDCYVWKHYKHTLDDIWGDIPSKTECGDEENMDESDKSNEILKGAKYGSDESDIDKSASNKSAADGDNDNNRKRKRCGDFDQEPQQKKRKIMVDNKNKLSSTQLLREMEIHQKIKELHMELALADQKKKHIALMRSTTQKEGKQWIPCTLNNGTTGVRCIQAKSSKVCNRMFVTLNEWCNHECE